MIENSTTTDRPQKKIKQLTAFGLRVGVVQDGLHGAWPRQRHVAQVRQPQHGAEPGEQIGNNLNLIMKDLNLIVKNLNLVVKNLNVIVKNLKSWF